MKKRKKEAVQPENQEVEQPVEEPKEVETLAEEPAEETVAQEETVEPIAEEVTEPAAEEEPKQKKGMPRFVKFLIFELIAIIIALGAQYCLLEFVLKSIELEELIKWLAATGAGFVLYLVAGYLFSHLIVYKGKGRKTFIKFLLSAIIGCGLLIGLSYLGAFALNAIIPDVALHSEFTALSINHILTHEGMAMIYGFAILACALILMIIYSCLVRSLLVFKDKKAKEPAMKEEEAIEEEAAEEEAPQEEPAEEEPSEEKEEAQEEVKEEEAKTEEPEAKETVAKEEPKEEKPEEEKPAKSSGSGEPVTYSSLRQIFREEMDKFFYEKKKYVRREKAHDLLDEELAQYKKEHSKK